MGKGSLLSLTAQKEKKFFVLLGVVTEFVGHTSSQRMYICFPRCVFFATVHEDLIYL